MEEENKKTEQPPGAEILPADEKGPGETQLNIDSTKNNISSTGINIDPGNEQIQKLQPIISSPGEASGDKTKVMEVHHHGHVHERIKWKEYLFQFLMLFLAVFCGFLAEYKLEHVLEKNRAKDYAASMVTDLSSDTTELKNYIRYFTYASRNVDTLLKLLTDNGLKEIPSGKLYWYGLWGGAPRIFVPNDATLQQMKNSGSLRYFTNKLIAREVARYDQICREMKSTEDNDIYLYSEVRKMRAQIFEFRYNAAANNIVQGNWGHFNQQRIDSFIRSNPPLLTYNESVFNQYIELVRSRFLERKLRLADSLLSRATVLLVDLKKEYHL